jgi:hypothetical protein
VPKKHIGSCKDLNKDHIEMGKKITGVSKDGLLGHHWKERPIGQANFICPSTGERQGQKMGMGG